MKNGGGRAFFPDGFFFSCAQIPAPSPSRESPKLSRVGGGGPHPPGHSQRCLPQASADEQQTPGLPFCITRTGRPCPRRPTGAWRPPTCGRHARQAAGPRGMARAAPHAAGLPAPRRAVQQGREGVSFWDRSEAQGMVNKRSGDRMGGKIEKAPKRIFDGLGGWTMMQRCQKSFTPKKSSRCCQNMAIFWAFFRWIYGPPWPRHEEFWLNLSSFLLPVCPRPPRRGEVVELRVAGLRFVGLDVGAGVSRYTAGSGSCISGCMHDELVRPLQQHLLCPAIP